MTEIRDLLSFKLHRVANLLSRGAELRYRREFGVSLWEWRTIAFLGRSSEPMSLGQLAQAASIDKGQMSRVVAGLTKRRMVLREAHPADLTFITQSSVSVSRTMRRYRSHSSWDTGTNSFSSVETCSRQRSRISS